VHRDMCPCIVTCDRASWHVTVHRDMWPCIVTCVRASWHVTVHGDKFLYNEPTRRNNFSNLFWNETLHVSDSSSVIHQELFTVHSAMVYVIQDCRQLSTSRIRMELLELCLHTTCNKNRWIIRGKIKKCSSQPRLRCSFFSTLLQSKLVT
jgi:hypothetical protein